MPEEEVDQLGGTLLDEGAYDELVDTDCDVYRPDGTVLLKLRTNAVTAGALKSAYEPMQRAATLTDNRGYAGGQLDAAKLRGPIGKNHSATRYQRVKRDGTQSKTNSATPVHSGIVGYFDRTPRFPYCRTTAYVINDPERFKQAHKFFREVAAIFRIEMPDEHEYQNRIARETHPAWVIDGTPFTTVTVNRNWQTAVHKDAGDLLGGFGVMSCFRGGVYTGGHLVFPRYRVAVNMTTGCVLLADVHEWHGNTPIVGRRGRYERLTTVFYYREHMLECGSPQEELDRAKHRKEGDPVRGRVQ